MLKTKKFIIDKNFCNALLSSKLYSEINKKKLLKYHLNTILKFKQISFEQLILFYTVVLSGSINSASKRLSLSQPAISLAFQKIEQQLGYLLLKNSNSRKSLALTSYGSFLFNYVERVFQILNDVITFNNLNSTYHSSYLKKNLVNKDFNYDRFSIPVNKINNYNFNSLCFQKVFSKHFKIFMMSRKLTLIPVKIEKTTQKFSSLNFKCGNFIELHTVNAIQASVSMKISHSTYWGIFM